jgi:hypothetical protein
MWWRFLASMLRRGMRSRRMLLHWWPSCRQVQGRGVCCATVTTSGTKDLALRCRRRGRYEVGDRNVRRRGSRRLRPLIAQVLFVWCRKAGCRQRLRWAALHSLRGRHWRWIRRIVSRTVFTRPESVTASWYWGLLVGEIRP